VTSRRITVNSLPYWVALVSPLVFLAAAAAIAASGHTKYAVVLGACVVAAPALTYLAITTEPAITASITTALTVFGGNWHYMHVPVPLDRVGWLATLAALAWRYMLKEQRFHGMQFRPVHAVLAFATAYAICSAVLSDTLTSTAGIVGILDTFGLVPFLLFFFAPAIFPTAKHRQYLVAALVVLGLYLGLTACFEGLSLNSLVFPRYILNPNIGEHYGRARGPFLEAAGNGLGLYICVMASLIALRTWVSRWARAIGAIAGCLCLAGVIFTLTREVWVGVLLASFAVGVATPELRRYVVPGAVLMAIAVVAVIVVVPSFRTNATTRLDTNRSVWDRLNADSAGIRMFEERPLLGFGWATYSEDVGPYYRLASTYPLTTVGAIHNEFLGNLVALGALGTGLWLAGLLMGIVAPLLRRGPPGERRIWWSALLGVLICWTVVVGLTPGDFAFTNAAIWLLAGVTYAIDVRAPVHVRAVVMESDSGTMSSAVRKLMGSRQRTAEI
jgi:putative inorganic carbon (hco3(-)) transporter